MSQYGSSGTWTPGTGSQKQRAAFDELLRQLMNGTTPDRAMMARYATTLRDLSYQPPPAGGTAGP